MYNHLLYLLYWLVNAVVLFGLSWIFPNSVILGTNKFVPLEAAIYSGFWLTFFIWTMWDFIIAREVKLEPAPLAFIYFLFVNILGIWIVTYAGRYTGIAVAGWWILVVAVFADSLQRLAWKLVVKRS